MIKTILLITCILLYSTGITYAQKKEKQPVFIAPERQEREVKDCEYPIGGIGPEKTSTDTLTLANKIYHQKETDKKAEYPGGMGVFNKRFIYKFFTPKELKETEKKKVQFVVLFTIEKDGTLSDIAVKRLEGLETDTKIKRVLKEMPPWKPAIKDGVPVRSYFILPTTIL